MESTVLVAILGLVGILITVVCSIVNICLTYYTNLRLEKNIRRHPMYIGIAHYTREEIYAETKGTNNLILCNEFSKNLKKGQKYFFLKIKNESEFYFANAIVQIDFVSYNLGFFAPKVLKIIPIEIEQNLKIKIIYKNEFDEKLEQLVEYAHDKRKIVKNVTYLHKKFRKKAISNMLSSGAFMTVQQFHKHF